MDLTRQFDPPVTTVQDINFQEKRFRPESGLSASSENTPYRFNVYPGPADVGGAYIDMAFICQSAAGASIATYATGTATSHTALRPDFFNSIFSRMEWGCDDYSETINLEQHQWVVSMIEDHLLQPESADSANKTYPLDYVNGLRRITSETLTSTDFIDSNNAIIDGGSVCYLRLDLPTGCFFKNCTSLVDLPERTYMTLYLSSPAAMFVAGASVTISPVISSISKMDLCINYASGETVRRLYAGHVNARQFISVPKFDIKHFTVASGDTTSILKSTIHYLPNHIYLVYRRAWSDAQSNRIFNFGNVKRAHLTINNSEPIGAFDNIVSNADKSAVWEQLKKATQNNLEGTVLTKTDMLDSLNSNIDNWTIYAFPVASYLQAQNAGTTYDCEVNVTYNSTAAIATTAYVIACFNAVLTIDKSRNSISRLV